MSTKSIGSLRESVRQFTPQQSFKWFLTTYLHHVDNVKKYIKVFNVSLWLIGTVRTEAEMVISRAWVQSPDPAK